MDPVAMEGLSTTIDGVCFKIFKGAMLPRLFLRHESISTSIQMPIYAGGDRHLN